MTTLFVAFSHTLTDAQISDAKASLGVDGIITLSETDSDLQKKFSQVPAQATTKEIVELAQTIVGLAQKAGAKFFYVAGEPSLVIHASLEAKKLGLEVVQSTTERRSVETLQSDGTVVKSAIFAHVQWRKVF